MYSTLSPRDGTIGISWLIRISPNLVWICFSVGTVQTIVYPPWPTFGLRGDCTSADTRKRSNTEYSSQSTEISLTIPHRVTNWCKILVLPAPHMIDEERLLSWSPCERSLSASCALSYQAPSIAIRDHLCLLCLHFVFLGWQRHSTITCEKTPTIVVNYTYPIPMPGQDS